MRVVQYIHVCLRIQLFLKMWFSTSYDKTWHVEAAICKKRSFLLFYTLLVKFRDKHRGNIEEYWQNWMGQKMPLYKWYTFWMTPWLICYFIVNLFIIERKWLLMRNSKLPRKFQRFNDIDGSIEMLENREFPKFLIKMKICKTFFEAQITSRLNEPSLNLPPTR